MYMCTYVHVGCAVLFSIAVCLTLLASFSLSSASLLNIYIHKYIDGQCIFVHVHCMYIVMHMYI